jgi:hypothetical protein
VPPLVGVDRKNSSRQAAVKAVAVAGRQLPPKARDI